MTIERIHSRFAWLAAIAVFMISLPSAWAKDSTDAAKGQPSEAAEELVQSEGHKKWAERQEAVLEEARTALEQTHLALTALESDDEKAALDALALATGKLEILLAREPTLALAPISVDYAAHDLYASIESVKAIRGRVIDLLDDGRVQEARALLSGLASEFVISVTNLPLGTYPDAIKAVSPLIDEGKVDEAKRALRAVLDTLVVTKNVIPLPITRASLMLAEAESLLAAEGEVVVTERETAEEGDEGVEAPTVKIEDLVAGARRQLELSQALGYGDKAVYTKLRNQMAELEKKIGSEQETESIFAKLQGSLKGFRSSVSE